MNTKDEPGPFDALQKAKPGEPVFTLRAHDPLAAPLVHEWVNQRREAIRAARASLNNAIAEANEAGRDLRLTLGMVNECAAILALAAKLADVSAHIAPKRTSYYPGQPLPPPYDLKRALVCMADVIGDPGANAD